jgi:hypothetical protein
MAETNALVTVEQAVTDYLLAFKKTTEDYIIYVRHACTLLTDFMIHTSQEARSEKIAVSALGIIEMPDDLIKLHDVCIPRNGEWWTMTERSGKVNTTTFTGFVEGQDSTFGEGVDVKDGITTTFGARGAVNDYYYMVDYKARRIFVDGIKSDTVLIKYVSSGISTTATTYIPILVIPMLEAYLLWKESFWIDKLARERDSRYNDYRNEKLRVRNVINGMTTAQWNDIIWGSFTQTPKR